MHSTRQNQQQQQRQSSVAAALTAAAAPDSRPSADCRQPPPTPSSDSHASTYDALSASTSSSSSSSRGIFTAFCRLLFHFLLFCRQQAKLACCLFVVAAPLSPPIARMLLVPYQKFLAFSLPVSLSPYSLSLVLYFSLTLFIAMCLFLVAASPVSRGVLCFV